MIFHKQIIILIILIFNLTSYAGNVISLSKANILKTEGINAFNLKDYQAAEDKLLQALNAFKNYGKITDYLICAEALCSTYEYLGKYNDAISLKTAQMDIHSAAFSDSDRDYSLHLGALAHLYGLIGDYAKAIDLSMTSLKIKQNLFGPEDDETVTTLGNIAYYYAALGNYDIATEYMEQVREVIIKTKGEDSIDYANILNYFAAVMSRIELYDWAVEMERKCVDIMKKHKNQDLYFIALQNLALYMVKADKNKLDTALKLTKESLDIQISQNKNMTPFYGIGLCNLMSYYVESRKYSEAEKYGIEALNLFERLYGNSHPDITTLWLNFASLYMSSKDYDKAIVYIEKATNGYIDQTLNAFKFLTKNERTYYWLRYETWSMLQLPLYAMELKCDQVNRLAYNALTFSKSLILNSENAISEIILNSADNNLKSEYTTLKHLYSNINMLSQQSIDKPRCNIDSLRNCANELEKHIMMTSQQYGDFTHNLSIGWQNIQNGLKNNEVAIEFWSSPFNSSSDKYLALILKKDYTAPKLIELCIPDKIDTEDYATLTNYVWLPILSELDNIENIYFSPSGQLHNLPIESFPIPMSNKYMSERYNIYRLSSTREIVLDKSTIEGDSVAIYGGLRYNMTLSELEENSKLFPKSHVRGEDININDIRGAIKSIKYLPGTKKEAEKILSIMQNSKIANFSITKYFDNEGTETSFKNLSGKNNRIIHIGTHGFYINDASIKRLDSISTMQKMMGNKSDIAISVEDKALSRSGLFMAGADYRYKGGNLPNGLDDGILTSYEISTMDLSGLDLISLSACETAKGDIMGDGVFGLQRGFKKAGAKSIIMSLWSVDDNATCELMTEFYDNWLNKGFSKHQSLENAKAKVRANIERGWDDPKYWASFILLDAID